MADAIDIALAGEQLLGPGVRYGSAATYDDLVRTWEDTRWPAPSLAELEEAWSRYEPPLPETVGNLHFKEALIEAGIFPEDIDQHLAAIEDRELRAKATLRWQQSRIALADPLLRSQADALGIEESALKAIFRRAVEIEGM